MGLEICNDCDPVIIDRHEIWMIKADPDDALIYHVKINSYPWEKSK